MLGLVAVDVRTPLASEAWWRCAGDMRTLSLLDTAHSTLPTALLTQARVLSDTWKVVRCGQAAAVCFEGCTPTWHCAGGVAFTAVACLVSAVWRQALRLVCNAEGVACL